MKGSFHQSGKAVNVGAPKPFHVLTHDKDQVASLAKRAGLRLVVLFGSQARDTARPGSDVDVAVMDEGNDDTDLSLDLLYPLGKSFGRFDLDIVWLPHAPWLLSWEIARDGQALYEAIPGLFREFQVTAALRRADSAHWRARGEAFLTRWRKGALEMNRDVIRRKLESMARFIDDLDLLLERPEEEFLSTGLTHYIGERLLELLVEYAAEINTEVAQSVASIPPSDYYSSFFSLGQTGWLDSDSAHELARCAGLRNRLVHQYSAVQTSTLYEALKRSSPVWRRYVTAIHEKLRETEKPP